MEGRRAHAVAHLAYARSQKSGTGILGSKRVLQGGEKSSPLVVLCDLWLVYRVYGLGGEKWKCGPGREIMVLGQMLVAGSVVRGEKLRVWAKHWWREVWSRERNRAPGSSPSPPECGPRREIMVFGQTLVAGSVVQGEKLRFRSTPSPPECGPRREIMVLGQALVAGSVVQGAKLRPRSPPSPPECGLGSKTVPLGQAQPRPSVARGEKLWSWVKR